MNKNEQSFDVDLRKEILALFLTVWYLVNVCVLHVYKNAYMCVYVCMNQKCVYLYIYV